MIDFDNYQFIVSWRTRGDGRLHSRSYDKSTAFAGESFALGLMQDDNIFDVRVLELKQAHLTSNTRDFCICRIGG